MGRSIYCSTCKKEKEPGRDNESRCKACKSQANKEKRARQREEKGLPALGSGRSIYCYDCKSVKERQDYGYCNACRRKKDNENRLASGVTKKHQTGKCPCGEERAPYSKSYCVDCLSKRSAERRQIIPLTREQKDKINATLRNKRAEKVVELKPELEATRLKYRLAALAEHNYVIRHRVRALTRSYIKSGRLTKLPCEICKVVENVEAHHDDYTKPLDIRWLCRKHHREHHKNNP